MKYFYLFVTFITLAFFSCQNDRAAGKAGPETSNTEALTDPAPTATGDAASQLADPELQEKLQNLKPNANNQSDEPILLKGVNLTYPLVPYMVAKGQQVYERKCASCHTLTTERLRAAGFAGITKRRRPEWIMNFTTAVDTPLGENRREEAKLRNCPTRQLDQRLSIMEARDILEMFRKNDGEK